MRGHVRTEGAANHGGPLPRRDPSRTTHGFAGRSFPTARRNWGRLVCGCFRFAIAILVCDRRAPKEQARIVTIGENDTLGCERLAKVAKGAGLKGFFSAFKTGDGSQ